MTKRAHSTSIGIGSALLSLLLAGAAPAATVQVVANIQSFSGVVGSDAQFSTFFDQHDGRGPLAICPDGGCGTGIGVATIDSTTPEDPALGKFDLGTADLEFWNTNFGQSATHNRIRFTAAPAANVALGQDFLMGTLSFTNGTWFTDPDFELVFVSSSSDAAFDGFVWTGALHLSITPNSTANTPVQNADFLWFTNSTTLGSVRAYEISDSPTGDNTVIVDIYGHINSLDLTRFDNATGGGFLDPSVGLLPEPSALVLLGGGALALMWRRHRRRSH